MNKKRLYKSFSQLSTGYTINTNVKLDEDNFNISQIDVKFSNAIENITSPKVMSLLSYRLILHDYATSQPFRTPDKKKLEKEPELKNINKDDLLKTIRQKKDSLLLLNPADPTEKKYLDLLEAYKYDYENLKKGLIVSRYQRTDYINIAFFSENPNLSAFIVNALIEEFRNYFESFRKERTGESVSTLDSLVKKRKEELDDKIALKTQFLSDSSVLDPNVETSNLQQIGQFETSLAEEQGLSQNLTYQVQQLTVQIASLESGTSRPAEKVDNNDEYMILRKQYNDLYSEYVKNGSSDPDMKKRLDALLQKMQSKISTKTTPKQTNDASAGGQIELLKQRKIDAEGQLRAANVKIAFYQRRLSELKGSMGSQNSHSASLQQIEKEIEIANAEYTDLKDKLNTAMNLSEGGSNFKQTMFGQPDYTPEPSGRFMIILLSGASAFILTCLVFIFIQYFDPSIKAPSQFQRQTGLKLLGIINWVPVKKKRISEQVIVDNENDESEVRRNNSFRELLRKLRFEIENSGKRVLLFTSTEPQQGKTTLAQAVAFSLSQGRKKVLIIDTNFCNNDITVYNDARPTIEHFSNSGDELTKESLMSLVSGTDVDEVDLVGCKGGDYTPSEILPKNHLLNYMRDILKYYDFVLMEGAPLNGYTDSKELVQYAEGVIAIFSAQSEVKQVDKESIKFLKDLKGKFLGGVLNKVESPNINA